MINVLLESLMRDKRKFWTGVGVSLSFILFTSYFLLLPQVRDIAELNKKTAKLRSDLKAVELDVRQKMVYKKKAIDYRQKIKAYEKRMPSREDIPSLLEALSDKAVASGTKIISMAPVKFIKRFSGKKAAYHEVPILVSARSGYHQLGAFINRIESADFFMKVEDIQIRSNARTPTKHDVELLLLTYVLPREI